MVSGYPQEAFGTSVVMSWNQAPKHHCALIYTHSQFIVYCSGRNYKF